MIFVTGATGFLGQHLMRQLPCATPFPPSRECDLRKTVVQSSHMKTLVHLAASCGGIGANQSRPATFLDDNVSINLNVFRLAHATGARLVCAGSVCAYPEITEVPFHEQNLWGGKPEPTNHAYGESKRLLVTLSEAYYQQYGFRSTVLLLTNLYGPGDNFGQGSHAVAALVRKFVDAQRLGLQSVELWGTSRATRDFLYVEDAAKAFAHVLREDSEPLMNVGTGQETSINKLAHIVKSVVGYRGSVVWDTSKPDGQPRRCLDISRIRRIGWEPETNLREGIERTVEWYRSQTSG